MVPAIISIISFLSVWCRFVVPFLPEMNAGRRHHNLYMTCLWLVLISAYTNATFNFVVYYTMGSRYRHTFWTLVGRKSARTNANTTSEIALTLLTASWIRLALCVNIWPASASALCAKTGFRWCFSSTSISISWVQLRFFSLFFLPQWPNKWVNWINWSICLSNNKSINH